MTIIPNEGTTVPVRILDTDIMWLTTRALRKNPGALTLELRLPLTGDAGKLIFLTHPEACQFLVKNHEEFTPGGMGVTLTKLMQGSTGLSNTAHGHPARDIRAELVQTMNNLFDQAVKNGELDRSISQILKSFGSYVGDPRGVIHQILGEFINTSLFGGQVDDMVYLITKLQSTLNGVIPYYLADTADNRVVRWLMRKATGPIGKSATSVSVEIDKLIAKHKQGYDCGIVSWMLTDGGLNEAQTFGHVHSLLQGLLDTTGNASVSAMWILSKYDFGFMQTDKEYRAFAQMAMSVLNAATMTMRSNVKSEVYLGDTLYPRDSVFVASLFHHNRHIIGLDYGIELDYLALFQRFLTREDVTRTAYSYAFGGQSVRRCIGRHIAEEIVTTLIATLCRRQYRVYTQGEARYESKLTGSVGGIRMCVSIYKN